MTPRLYKATEVCDMAQLQPYVLRSWEKEFPGIGLQRSDDSPRLYRQSDVEQVLRIKQLVFVEGLTLAGARRRIDESAPPPAMRAAEITDFIEVLGADAHKRIAHVRDGLRSLLHLLNGEGDAFQLAPPPAIAPRATSRPVPARKVSSRSVKSVRKIVATRGKGARTRNSERGTRN